MDEWDERLRVRARREDTPVPEGFDGRLSARLEALPRRRAAGLTRGRGLLLAAALCAALAVSALAVSPVLREQLAGALGGFRPYAQQVDGVSATDRGVRVTVLSALSDSRNVRLYLSLEDLEGDRLGDCPSLDYDLSRPVEEKDRLFSGCSGYIGAGRDPETGAVLLVVNGRDDSLQSGAEVTLRIDRFHLPDGRVLEGDWSLTTPLEPLEELRIPLEGTSAPAQWRELRLSPLCMSLDLLTDDPGRDDLWGVPATVTLADGTVLAPPMESSGWGIYYADGNREAEDPDGLGVGVSTWVFQDPLDLGQVSAVSIGGWSKDLEN